MVLARFDSGPRGQMYRIAFDPALPLVAASPFDARGKRFASGAEVDWRELGVSEAIVYDWWLAGLVVHPVPDTAKQVQAEPEPAAVLAHVELEKRPHKQRRARR